MCRRYSRFMVAGPKSEKRQLPEGDAKASQCHPETYAIFTGSGVRVDLASFFRSESGKKALKDVADSAKRGSVRRAKSCRSGR